MGQYFKVFNLDKKEMLSPRLFHDGEKLLEFGCSANGTLTGLTILLRQSSGVGGGAGSGAGGGAEVSAEDLVGLVAAGAAAAGLESKNVERLDFGINESYSISISTAPSGAPRASIGAATVFGALRALETFTQLATSMTAGAAVPSDVRIEDSPRFPYRGLMIDTGRHWLPVPFIEHIMDAMAASKLNILHWHITDDQAFPLDLDSVPELAAKGSFGPKFVYSHDDIHRLTS